MASGKRGRRRGALQRDLDQVHHRKHAALFSIEEEDDALYGRHQFGEAASAEMLV